MAEPESTLYVRQLPEEIKRAIQEEARREHRSLSAQVLIILRDWAREKEAVRA